MWKKEESRQPGVQENAGTPAAAQSTNPKPLSTPRDPREGAAPPVSAGSAACISQGIRIKGEVTGSEDLFIDGHVDGKLNLANGSLTIGPNGSVKADVTAREVIVRGRLEGKISGRERVQLWSTGQVNGDVQTERLSIEDGAVFRGKVESGKLIDKATEARAAGASTASSSKPSGPMSLSSGTAAD
jgi:cytoskeletal protein CcmA (bactofilin family)